MTMKCAQRREYKINTSSYESSEQQQELVPMSLKDDKNAMNPNIRKKFEWLIRNNKREKRRRGKVYCLEF